VTAELRAEGYAREAVRLIQDARKSAGLAVSDRIVVRWSAAGPELAAALAGNGPLIAGEVLAVSFSETTDEEQAGGGRTTDDEQARDGRTTDDAQAPGGPWHEYADDSLGLRFWLATA
jgi:Domain of unknown function (DUF5915)